MEMLEERFGATLPSDLRDRIMSADAADLRTWLHKAVNAPDLSSVFK